MGTPMGTQTHSVLTDLFHDTLNWEHGSEAQSLALSAYLVVRPKMVIEFLQSHHIFYKFWFLYFLPSHILCHLHCLHITPDCYVYTWGRLPLLMYS